MPDHSSPRSTVLVPPTTATATTQDPTMRMIFEDPDEGTELVRVFEGSNVPATVEVRFEPGSPNETLVGQPSAWSNSPGAGQPLVFDVPVPTSPGDPDTVDVLRVTASQAGTTVRIPIRIAHAE